jgi:aspartate/methionine/tyrosine aminotransferase
MAQFPRLSAAVEAMPLSIFARLYERLARFTGDVIPLQIGDTYLSPPVRLHELGYEALDDRELYAYAPPQGWGPLVDGITAKVRAKNHIAVAPAGVQVTCGATHGLSCTVGALLDPGDEMILLTPHWPLIKGIAQSRSVVPVEVPFTMVVRDDPGADPVALLEAAVTPRTAAIYLCTPNNPDGVVMSERELRAVAEVAERHNLWILSDEVYENHVYEGTHVSIGSLGVADRTITMFSFSKSHAQAGLRIGYAVGPAAVMSSVRKLANHTVYNVPVALQRAGLGALERGEEFLTGARRRYAEVRDLAHARIAAPCRRPEGGTYLFLDLRQWSRGRGCLFVLEQLAEAGVLLAPGAPFGEAYDGWARLCFTSVDEARLIEGIDRINGVLAAAPCRSVAVAAPAP